MIIRRNDSSAERSDSIISVTRGFVKHTLDCAAIEQGRGWGTTAFDQAR